MPKINSIEDHHSDGLERKKASNSKALPNSTAILTIRTPLLASYDLKTVLQLGNDQGGDLLQHDYYWTIFRNTVGALWYVPTLHKVRQRVSHGKGEVNLCITIS